MSSERGKFVNWGLFLVLSFIWGSSFILMKEGLKTLSAYQVAAIRILSAGIVLLPVGLRAFRKVPLQKIGYIVLSGLLGSFIPAFLFCLAETHIDSSLAGFLNSLTPIFVIIIGILFYKSSVEKHKITGIIIGFCGMVLLFLGKEVSLQYISFASFVILATILYAANVNMVSHYLKEVGSLNIAAVGFIILIIPSLTVLLITGYFNRPLLQKDVLLGTAASSVLGIMGTAVATILFYVLLKRAGAIFSSMVTYGIPFFALFWGLLAGESITILQVLGMAVILTGVYITNRRKREVK